MNVDLLSALNNSLPSLSPLGVGTLLATQQPTTIQINKDEEESSKWDAQIQRELDALFSHSCF